MDDTYLVSVTSEIASSIRENVRALSVEIEGTDGDGFKLIVDKHMHRCEVPTNCTVELWKSLDGVHSLKSNDMQRALISEAESQKLNLDRSQHCELADPSSGLQSLNVELDISRLTSSHAASKATTFVEYIATVEQGEG